MLRFLLGFSVVGIGNGEFINGLHDVVSGNRCPFTFASVKGLVRGHIQNCIKQSGTELLLDCEDGDVF